MKRGRVLLWVLLSAGGLAAIPCGFFGLWFAASAGTDRGSPTLAAEWRDHLARFDGPDDAVAADPEIAAMRFSNGEWALVKAQDSHGIWRRGGGTVVVRDSGGRTRVFFGHVCGAGRDYFGCLNLKSLDALDKYLV